MDVHTEGEDRKSATTARQAGWQFAFMASAGILNASNQPDRQVVTITVLVFGTIGLSLLFSPARLWGPRGNLALTAVLFVCLGISTWSAGDKAILAAPGFLVAYVWLGLHQSVRLILLSAPFVIAIHVLALWLAGAPAEQIGVTFVGTSVAIIVGLVISSAVSQARSARAEIRAEERWRAAIMATLAHDVRSPLTSIVGVLEIMEDDARTPDTHRVLLQGASRQAARILRLSAGLLAMERVDQGRLTLDRRHLPLADLLADIATTHPALALTWDVPPDLTVWADRERLEQVLVNLATNAVRHGSPPVQITATSAASGVSISVRDHGDGVPQQHVQQLFEKFSSADTSPHSIGLGLWIVRLLTEAHGGSVRYEPGDPGARFVVHLPHDSVGTESPVARTGPSQLEHSSKT